MTNYRRDFDSSGLNRGRGFVLVTLVATVALTVRAGVSTPKTPVSKPAEASVPSEPASPSKFDIVGLQLGMTPEESHDAMKRHDEKFKIVEQRATLQGLPGSTFLSEVTGGLDRRLPVGAVDAIGVHFAPPPQASTAIFVTRFTGFEDGKQPLVATMKDALIDKYGAPSYVRDAGFDVRMTWAFDLSGAQLSGKDVERRCIRFDVLDPQNTANILFEDRKSEGCGLTIQATMGRNQVQMNAGELARYLSIYMIDGSKFPDMRSATQAYVENEVREAAKKAPTPKL